MIQSVKQGLSIRPSVECLAPLNKVTWHRGEKAKGPGVQPVVASMSHIFTQAIAAQRRLACDPACPDRSTAARTARTSCKTEAPNLASFSTAPPGRFPDPAHRSVWRSIPQVCAAVARSTPSQHQCDRQHLAHTARGPGTLAASAFRSSTTGLALDASDRIMYNSANGALYSDADGTGAGARVLMATMTPGLALVNWVTMF